MPRHLVIVANAFRTAGLLIGTPSLLAFLWLAVLWVQLWWLKPDRSVHDAAPTVNIQRDGLVGLLVAGATVVGKGLEFASNVATWVLGALSVAAAVLTVAGVTLFFTGRGLFAHAAWARVFAGLASALVLVVSFLVLTSLRRSSAAVALIPLGLSGYALWVLIRRFN